jgi:hypothetical protein
MSVRWALVLVLAAACGEAETRRAELSFTPDALPEGQVGQEYTVAITVSGNETPVDLMQVAEGSLPPGLALQHTSVQQTAFVDGTPTQPGSYSFTIRAACFGTMRPGQVGSKAYGIVVR